MKRNNFHLLLIVVLLPATACTTYHKRHQRANAASTKLEAQLQEESRALTTALVDVLAVAPTNRHAEVALQLARQDQQIEGTPVSRIEVTPLLTNESVALQAFDERVARQNSLLKQRAVQQAAMEKEEARLLALGIEHEKARNKNIVRRFFGWAAGTLGIGGMIAVCILCPALIPFFGKLISWVLGRIPALSGYFGLVSRKAFDEGVGRVRASYKKEEDRMSLARLDEELLRATDAESRRIIEHSRTQLGI